MTYYSTPPRSDELYHYGVKGQKWGVRRYENYDGTLTKAGKERYSDSQKKQDARLYGRRSVKRIQKRVDNGETIVSARHAEVVRKKRREKALTIASIAIPATLSAALLGTAKYRDNKLKKERNAKIREALNKNSNLKRQIMDFYNDAIKKQNRKITMDDIKKSYGDRTVNNGISDDLKKILKNTQDRENSANSAFEKKMKEYWDKTGRKKWEKKNRKNKPF